MYCAVVICHTGSCAGIAVLMCQNSKKEFYKKFLYEPLPVEVGGHDSSKQNENKNQMVLNTSVFYVFKFDEYRIA